MRDVIALDRVVDLSEADREAVRRLGLAVYPPTESASWPGRQLEWYIPEWCVRFYDDVGALASYVGISLRQALHDGQAVRVGGIGSVKTHPAARRRGLAGRAVNRALEFLRGQPRVGFALLVCGPHLIQYYGRLGWQEFDGRLLVEQRGATVEFTFNRVMTCEIQAPAPRAGTIDLLGPPW